MTPQSMQQRSHQSFTPPATAPRLTVREVALVFELATTDDSLPAIARRLHMTTGTARQHVRHILLKLPSSVAPRHIRGLARIRHWARPVTLEH